MEKKKQNKMEEHSSEYWHVQRLGDFYGWLGEMIVIRPYTIIFLSIIISSTFGIGLNSMVFQTASTKLWVDHDSKEAQDDRNYNKTFSDDVISTQMFIQRQLPNTNLLDKKHLLEIFQFHQTILQDIKVNGKTFNDLCERIFEDGPCTHWNIFHLFNLNQTKVLRAIDAGMIEPTLMTLGKTISLETLFGGISPNEAKEGKAMISKLEAMVFVYNVDGNNPDSIKWQEKLINIILETQHTYIQTEVFSLQSIDNEIQRLVAIDSVLFGIAVIAIFIYLAITLGPMDMIKSRFLLSYTALLSFASSLVVSFGWSAWMGIEANPIVFLLSFIICGVGVDDIIVIVHYFDKYEKITDLKERMRKTLKHSGLAITLTSFTTVFSFISGAFTPLEGAASFCIHAAIAFFVAYCLAITMFPAFLVLDNRRNERGGHFLFPWIQVTSDFREKYSCIKSKGIKSESLSFDRSFDRSIASDELSIQNKTSNNEKYVYHDLYSSILCSGIGKIFTLILFIVPIFLILIFVFNNIKVGLLMSDVVPDSSYVNRAMAIYVKHWPAQVNTWNIVVHDMDYNNITQRNEIHSFLNWFENQTYALPPFGGQYSIWLRHLEQQLVNSSLKDNSTFLSKLDPLLSQYPNFKKDITCQKDNCLKVESSRYSIYVKDPYNTIDRVTIINQINHELQERNLHDTIYVYSPTLMFATTDDRIKYFTISSLITSIIALFITLLCFTSIPMSILISIIVAMIDINLLSTLVWWNIKLNAVSFVCLIMSVGLSVDYCVHMGHAYARALGSGNERVQNAIRSMAGSILKGGFTTFIGVCTLAFASSDAFRTFFKMLFCTVTWGLLHSLVFMPVVLALVGDYFIPPAVFIRGRSRSSIISFFTTHKTMDMSTEQHLSS